MTGVMRYGICTGLENARLLKETGYDYIELNASKTLQLTDREIQDGQALLRDLDLRAESWNVLFPKTINIVDGSFSEQDLQQLDEKIFSMIEGFGGKIAVFGSGKARNCPGRADFGIYYRRLLSVVRLTGKVAAQHGVEIVIEPLSRAETNMINTLEEGAILAADARMDNVSLLCDYYHVMKNAESLEYLRMVKPLKHIHIAASDGRRYPLGREGEQYEMLFAGLREIGYEGRMSIEGKTDNIEKDAPEALKLLRGLEKEADKAQA